jgi:hypothetical protein
VPFNRQFGQPRNPVGYWGGSVRTRVKAEMTLEKTRALLESQLYGGGLRAYLWQTVIDPRLLVTPISSTPPIPTIPDGLLHCSCIKASGQHADRKCRSCNGIGFIPGYKKFGNQTLWISSITPQLVLTNCNLNVITKPNRIQLDAGSLTGTIECPDIPFIRLLRDQAWEYRNDYILSDGNNSSVVAEFSINSGVSWSPISSLSEASTPPGVNAGQIRFKVTLNRNSTSVSSPQWEILRTRFPTIDLCDRFGPWILVLKTVPNSRNIEDIRGVQLDSSGTNFWTAPLSYFNRQVPDQGFVDQPLNKGELIIDPAFIQFLDGVPSVLGNSRWSVMNVNWSDPFGYVTKQVFQARQDQEQEFTSLVW